MKTYSSSILAASAAISLLACAKKEEAVSETAPAAETELAAVEPEAIEPETVEPVDEAAETDANQIGTATVGISIRNGALYFASAGEGFCVTGGGCQSGVTLDTGDVDLSSFPPGDVLVTVVMNSDAVAAGYSFPSDGYSAVAIAVDPPGDPVAPTPVFGQGNWPTGFNAPVVTEDGSSVSFTDLESDQNAYEYSIGVNGPNGRVVLDPQIKNGGGGNAN